MPQALERADARTEEDRIVDLRRADDEGLSSAEAADRLERYGQNVLTEERQSLLLEIGSHFWGPIPWMIEAALVLTALTARWADFAIIAALLLLNGVVGFWEEHQAKGAIDALRDRLARRARVKRDGEWLSLDAADVVPGDLAAVERGDVIPADAVILDGRGEADESTLTGESLPSEKAPGDVLHSGTVLVRGGPTARVVATGSATLFGRSAQLAQREPAPSHFQRALLAIGRYLIVMALVLVTVIVVVSLARGTSITDTLELALVVTIASVPVALPAVLSVTMAVGARMLAHHDAVVSHLPAMEEMAGVDVLCSDKTGTITRNELAVGEVVTLGEDVDRDDVLVAAALTSEPSSGDPIDQAISEQVDRELMQRYTVLDLEPFDPSRKRAEARIRGRDGTERRVAKGAVQAILELVGDAGEASPRVSEVTDAFAGNGYRALAVARTSGETGDWQIIGVLGLQDPPRDDSRDTLVEAGRLGVAVKMVTGDRVEIAAQVARMVGMDDDILEAEALRASDDSDEALTSTVEEAAGFAQVVPEDKYRIVELLQGHDHIVAMTGDGVNDVPALERADAGIAVSGATDAARAAADIVLLAPGLSTIIEAIHQAREVFQRMKNYAIYRITETIRVVLFVTITILVFGFFPVAPIQVVLLAILNDAAILSIAYDRVRGSSRPVRWDLTEVLTIATVLGLFGVVSSVGILWLAQGPLGLPDIEVQTVMYLKLSIAGHLTVFVARTQGPFWSYRPATILVVAVLGTQLLATLIALAGFLMQPISPGLAALAWAYALVSFVVLDRVKVITYRVLERRGVAAAELATA
jgi:H+-transporting ATPase